MGTFIDVDDDVSGSIQLFVFKLLTCGLTTYVCVLSSTYINVRGKIAVV